MNLTTDIAGAVGLLLLVLVIVVFFWLWSRHNEKASVERIKRYQAPLEVDTAPPPPVEGPPGTPRADMPAADMSHDLVNQLDGRIATLSRLMHSADEHAARLERAIEEAKRLGK